MNCQPNTALHFRIFADLVAQAASCTDVLGTDCNHHDVIAGVVAHQIVVAAVGVLGAGLHMVVPAATLAVALDDYDLAAR